MSSSAIVDGGYGRHGRPAPGVDGTPAAADERAAPARRGRVVRRPGASRERPPLSAPHPTDVPQHRLRTWTRRWRLFSSNAPLDAADAADPTARELAQLRGADPVLNALMVEELRVWRELTDRTDLSAEQRNKQLCTCCADAAKRVVGHLEPVSARLTVAAGRPADPLLGVVRHLPPPYPVGVPVAEELYAFSAAAAAHAGPSLSWAWLSAHIGSAVACGARVYKSPASPTGSLSSALVQWGSTLYVAVAGRRWDDWESLLKFLCAPLVDVAGWELLGGEPQKVPAGLPDTVAVNADALAACTELVSVLDAVREALTGPANGDHGADHAGAAGSRTASRVVFCGHGAAAAVVTLLALQYERRVSGEAGVPPAPPAVMTYGCPLMGDAALQAYTRRHLPAVTRWYVDHDPVAGLPRWSTIGLRCAPAAAAVMPSAARAHRVLSHDGVARHGVAAAPRVPSLSVAGVAYGSHHRLEAYALCLTRQWAGRAVAPAPAQESHPWWRRLWHVPPAVKGGVGGGVPTAASAAGG